VTSLSPLTSLFSSTALEAFYCIYLYFHPKTYRTYFHQASSRFKIFKMHFFIPGTITVLTMGVSIFAVPLLPFQGPGLVCDPSGTNPFLVPCPSNNNSVASPTPTNSTSTPIITSSSQTQTSPTALPTVAQGCACSGGCAPGTVCCAFRCGCGSQDDLTCVPANDTLV